MKKMKMKPLAGLVLVGSVIALFGCAGRPTGYGPNTYAPSYGTTPIAVQYGRVIQVDFLTSSPTSTSGGGAVLGAVVGAAVGNQFGKGDGRTAATAVGAVGGAIVGNEIERQGQQAQTFARVTIRMDNGSTFQLDESDTHAFRVGDRVRLQNGVVYRN
jgi:outer membrane lipoprotein SlyB